MTIRYPGAVWLPTPGKPGHRFYRRQNPLLVIHTRDSSRMGGVYPWPPHITLNPTTGDVRQHVEFNRSGMALKHSEPNRRGGRPTFQVETVAFARDVPHYGDAWYQGLADMISWFHHHMGVPLVFPKPFGGSETYGTHGTVRTRSAREWEALTGIVGHQHAYDNSHWDPGELDVARLQHFLHQTSHTPTHAPQPPEHHDIMTHTGGTVTLTIALPILRHQVPNTKGQHVGNLQGLLNAHGASLHIDEAFGPSVEKAVKAFQEANHLHADGIVGHDTWRHLL